MITAADFGVIVLALGDVGTDDIEWADTCAPPIHAEQFAGEAIFVICNSGMKNTVAVGIYKRVQAAILSGKSARTVFGHPGKAAAIDRIWADRESLLAAYEAAPDKVEYCGSLPWIGAITKYHLAKNFGAQVAKPDVHLKRLADREGITAQALCERLSAESGYKIATVDVLLWRACANGIIDSRTGAIKSEVVVAGGEQGFSLIAKRK